VLLKIVGVFTCRVLSLAVLAFRGGPAKDAGLLVPDARFKGSSERTESDLPATCPGAQRVP
jgi:hypothetical protein